MTMMSSLLLKGRKSSQYAEWVRWKRSQLLASGRKFATLGYSRNPSLIPSSTEISRLCYFIFQTSQGNTISNLWVPRPELPQTDWSVKSASAQSLRCHPDSGQGVFQWQKSWTHSECSLWLLQPTVKTQLLKNKTSLLDFGLLIS